MTKKKTKRTICLGIESTAHTFGIGIVDEQGKILANVKDMYSSEKGGLIPVELAKHHARVCNDILANSIKEAGIEMKNIDLIAYSYSPGLAPSLKEGTIFAKALAKELKVPLVPVNHCIAHLEIGKLVTNAKDPVYLFCSGANTQIIGYASGKYRVFGETLDVGVGNFIDNFARHAGIGFPGGPKIEELAKKGKNFIELPYSVKGMDVSFSGLLTNLKQKYDLGKYKIENLAYSLQETSFSMLAEVSERAMAHLNKKELVLIGGVGANKRFCEMLEIMCKERGAKFYSVPLSLAGDQGAMIAWTGIVMQNLGKKDHKISIKNIKSADFDTTERVDDVDIDWVEEK